MTNRSIWILALLFFTCAGALLLWSLRTDMDLKTASPIPVRHVEPAAASRFNPTNNQVETQPKRIESTAIGEWKLHRGKAIDTLKLTETGSVIKGSITLDPAWGGETFSLHGMRVGQEVEMFYSSETTRDGSDDYKTTADYSFKGKIEGDKMTGKCQVFTVSFFRSAQAIPTSGEILWIAEKTKRRP